MKKIVVLLILFNLAHFSAQENLANYTLEELEQIESDVKTYNVCFDLNLKKEKNEIVENCSENMEDTFSMAEFAGGINNLRVQMVSRIDVSVLGNVSSEAELTFIVHSDGSTSVINVKGRNLLFNREVKRAFDSIKNKWYPAHIGPIPVRSLFHMPLKF